MRQIQIHFETRTIPNHKYKILPFATIWKDFESIMLRDIRQMEKDKNHDFTHMRDIKQ